MSTTVHKVQVHTPLTDTAVVTIGGMEVHIGEDGGQLRVDVRAPGAIDEGVFDPVDEQYGDVVVNFFANGYLSRSDRVRPHDGKTVG